MKNIKLNKQKYFFYTILSIIFSVSLILGFIFNFNTHTSQAEIIYPYTIDDSTDSIIVVLDESISAINKKHDKSFFKGVDIESIVDLSRRERTLQNQSENFRQILQIFLKNSSPTAILEAMKTLSKLEGVQSVEPNELVEVESTIDETLTNDPHLKYLWGFIGEYGININKAWNFTKGSNEVRVGIIDSGISNHTDLNGNLATGWDFYNNNETTDDTNGHGTHIAGTIGAIGNNSTGVTGVNWNITLVPLQTSYNGTSHYISDLVEAIEWAINLDGTDNQIDIINYSISGFGNSTSIREAVREYNGLFVWSAGNQNTDVDTRINQNGSFNLSNLISVGAIKENGQRPTVEDWEYDNNDNPKGSNYSSSGINVNIYAPGDSIFSTLPTNSYGTMSGTSMAAPHVTGVAALLLSYNPNLTAAQLKTAIINGSDNIEIHAPNDDIPEFLPDTLSVKKLNATKALQYVMNNYGAEFNEEPFSKAIDANSSYFEESNCMLMINITKGYNRDFSISSTSALDITLYDENLDEIPISVTSINGGCQIDFSEDLSIGKYYLQATYISETATGTIEINITHTHEYNNKYVSLGSSGHSAFCECGAGIVQAHAVNGDDPPAKRRCIKCNQLVLPGDEGFIIMSLQAQYVTANGSFIAPDGVIYLVEIDIEAYLNDALIFYKKDDLPLESS